MNSKKTITDELTKKLMDEGRIIEAGWQAMRAVVLPSTVSDMQVSEMRKAFFAGAQHLFASIMLSMDPSENDEPTATDLRRMDLIHEELVGFEQELRAEIKRNRNRR